MENLVWKIFRCHPKAWLPITQPGSAGFDLHTVDTYIKLFPKQSHTFRTGLKCAFTPGYVALLWDRSGLGIQGIHRTAGVIDANYRGEWMVHLMNLGNQTREFFSGDRIVQVIFQKLPVVTYGEVFNENMLGQTIRGESGFGSTGQ